MRVKIADIIVSTDKRRPLRNVEALVESIREIGLQNPVTVTADKRLVAGLHRLEAAKRLGWTEIDATVVRLDALRTELAEIDENLVRNELTELERCEALARRKEIYEALHPETVQGTAGGRASGKARSRTTTESATVPSFVADTAAKTGRSVSAIYTDIRTAKNLDDEAKRVVRDTPLANKSTELRALSSVPRERQKRVAELAVSDDMPVAAADRVARGATVERQEQAASEAADESAAEDYDNRAETGDRRAPKYDLTVAPPNWRTQRDDHARVFDCMRRNMSVGDIRAETGLSKEFIHRSVAPYRVRARVMQDVIEDTAAIASSWFSWSKRIDDRWPGATEEEKAELVDALKSCRQSASLFIRELNKDARKENDCNGQDHQAEAV